MADKKITELPIASSVGLSDVSILVNGGTNYQYAFGTLLQLIGSNLDVGANISFGTSLPANTTGKNGDVFIKTDTGAFAQRTAGVWTIKYIIPATSGMTDGTVLYGLGDPGSGIGNNNDTYINTGTGVFYKKNSGAWNQVFSMQTGPQGPQGIAGVNGVNGINGFSLLSGTAIPSNTSTGVNGDFYLNTITYVLYGPKTGGVWGNGVLLAGAGLQPGGATGQVLVKNSNDDYDTIWTDPSGDTDSVSELPGAINKYFTESRVLNTMINGVGFLVSSAILATDTVLQALGKLQAQINGLLSNKADVSELNNHLNDHINPHRVSLEQARSQHNQLAGNIDANNNTIVNLADATDRKHPLTKGQFDDAFNAAGRNRGGLDCSSDPNYPASNSGDRWEVTVAGKIGGSAGVMVEVYDEIVCKTTSAAGDHTTVGSSFYIVQGNMLRATETTTGYSQIATNAQAIAMTNDDTFLTPLKGAALVDQKRKTVSYQVNVVSLNEVSILMENAGQVNNVLISGASNVKLKVGPTSTYPAGTQTYPFNYAAGDVVYVTFNYSNLADARCNVKLKCQDN